jgi:predicted YcjX-like family ATPase
LQFRRQANPKIVITYEPERARLALKDSAMALFGNLGASISDWLPDTPNFAELTRGSSINLAVTGLSRAGKTVFITSLIHNILSALHQPHRMPLLTVVRDGRLIGARLAGKREQLKRFPYEENIAHMAADPADWPEPTADISEIEIDIRFVPAGALGYLLGRIGNGAATLKLRIIDYPGEWLLDLPLLSQSYIEWSRATLKLCRHGIRAETARDFLLLLADRPYNGTASEQDARQLHALYRQHLQDARNLHKLNFLQPGRFLAPDHASEPSYMRFAPLHIPDGVSHTTPGTLAALMESRFEAYKAEAVTPFYTEHFRNFSRQVVLVDVLGALLAGREVFEDTRRAIDAILESFHYGHSGIIRRLLRSTRIEKALFAATKADHVPEVQRDHLAALLLNMVASSSLDLASSNAHTDVVALASVISTEDDTQEINGHKVQVVVGKPVGSNKRAQFFVGNVPARPPRAESWGQPFLNIPVFEPPVIDVSPTDGIAHINLDLALEYLIGDQLR